MPMYGPELIQIMRPRRGDDQNSRGSGNTRRQSAHGGVHLEGAAEGQITHDALLASASDHIQTVLSMLT
jgi:hypothetical protein